MIRLRKLRGFLLKDTKLFLCVGPHFLWSVVYCLPVQQQCLCFPEPSGLTLVVYYGQSIRHAPNAPWSLGTEGSSALQLVIINHDISNNTTYIYLPSLASFRSQDLEYDHRNVTKCQRSRLLSYGARSLSWDLFTFKYVNTNSSGRRDLRHYPNSPIFA